MNLHNLKPAEGSVKSAKRLGRGHGSGRGGTSTRGHKGAQSRSGYSRKMGFEGGQMPLQRRVPKFGFNRPQKVVWKPVNLDVLQELVDKTKAKKIDIEVLITNGIIGKNDVVKILGRGELKAKLEVEAHGFSKKAIDIIEEKGGKTKKL